VRLFPAAKPHEDFHCVSFSKKLVRFFRFEFQVVQCRADGDLHLLEFAALLVEPLLFEFFDLFVPKLVKIYDARDRRARGRRNQNEVQTSFARRFERFVAAHDAEFLAGLADDQNLGHLDRIVCDGVNGDTPKCSRCPVLKSKPR